MLFVLEVIGTVAFAISGALVAIEKKMDLFGVAMLIWLRGMYFCGEFIAISWGWIR